jgi:hypothetical protein
MPPVQGDAPDWVNDGFRQFVDEVRLFLRTAVDFTLKPVLFAREWATGQRHALNPLGFLATAFAVAGPARALFLHAVRAAGESTSLVRDALGALNPFGYYLALGALQHGVLRLCGSRRRLRDSCAMALYAGGGPALLIDLFVMVAMYFVWRATGSLNLTEVRSSWALAVMIGVGGSFTLFVTTLSASLAGLHERDGIRSRHIVVANLVAFLVTGVAFAFFEPPGAFGLHFIFGPAHDAAGWHFHWGLGD